ncbi:MAG: putative manganese-dependent inorganic diphosphatase [Traorella sp.]
MANQTIYVTGHKNPDSDSICSAMAYAYLKQQLNENAIAVRLGPLNEETKYILKRFNVENPLLLNDARSQIKDIDIDYPALIPMDMTMNEAWARLYTAKNKSLFVVDENNHLKGIVSTSNLSSLRGMEDEKMSSLMRKASVSQIAKTIKGKVVYEPENYQTDGQIYIYTLTSIDAYSERFKNSIVILSDDEEKQKELMECGAKCIIVTCMVRVSEEIRQYAVEKGCALIRTDWDTMKVAKIISEAIPVKYIMTPNPVTCYDDEYVSDVSQRLSQTRYRSYPVITHDGKVVGAVSRYHMSNYAKRRFILVDHSASNQSIPHIEDARIEEIIDHHHIGDIQTSHPIMYRNMICGCTSSIVSLLYKENGIIPPKEMAGLMLGAIISDTMYFKSKTTTEFDKKMAIWLADLAEVQLREFALGVLGASVSLKKSSPKEILNRDLKNYEIGKYKIGIGQTNFEHMEDVQMILPQFKEYLVKTQEEKGYDLLVMMFSNIMAEGSVFVFSGPIKSLMEGIIETQFDESTGFDSSIISRKQQLMPKVSELVNLM